MLPCKLYLLFFLFVAVRILQCSVRESVTLPCTLNLLFFYVLLFGSFSALFVTESVMPVII